MFNNDKNKIKSSKIIGIQFSVLSPDEIRKSSVAEINTRDTYINNKPVLGGLFDPRMGVLDAGLICPTDGLDYMETPGYFGHIEIARPVFYIQYINTLIKILRVICIKCGKLKLSKKKYDFLLKKLPKERWDFIFSHANKIKRCGDETEDGCGCKQPKKIYKQELANIYAEWENASGITDNEGVVKEKPTIKLSAETVLRILKRMSNEDIEFMGFSPLWAKPEWFICQVLAVPPPAVRPSVKHDSQQRSEDDISHIIVNIIKANTTLREKIEQGAPSKVIDDWTSVLQYYIATMIDNKIPGCCPVAQRSGRALKSIKERLVGKQGRVRGNLQGKRVDYSSRSVISPDANLSIKELGVPLKIAKNITFPNKVNKRNKNYLKKLVLTGPDGYPGANILERKNGDSISLRYVNRETLELFEGDIVHRHLVDGDPVLFNRQPTLHRMSMMCHIVKVMKVGNTFRMNVGDTKPYNADFDGDEMNMHGPQSEEAQCELLGLAAVPKQIISPANNQSIVGIFQDSLLGCYRFTRKDILFNERAAMNLLMYNEKIKLDIFKKGTLSSFDILSQVLPPMNCKFPNKQFSPDDDKKTSNDIIEIINGKYVRGQIDKGVLGGKSTGLILSIFNDYDYKHATSFIDEVQSIVTEYMKLSSYSVGINDLIADDETNKNIYNAVVNRKQEVKKLQNQVHYNVFENNSGKSNNIEFETQVNSILNKAQEEAGKIGRKSLSADNRFVIMVKAGSKGNNINIVQMISCLGQQNVDGKRIPYGFDDRTLPHYTKYDDSPEARGFVENSFIQGLTPEELYFHAMGGRTGLIDTAVKTSSTGYIQRRLIKSLEDISMRYDMTARNNKNKIIQFTYGTDGINTMKVENIKLPITKMSTEEIYAHFQMPNDKDVSNFMISNYDKDTKKRFKKQKKDLIKKTKVVIDIILNARDEIIEHVFEFTDNINIHIPVNFYRLINNVQNNLYITNNNIVDITPLEFYDLIEAKFNEMSQNQYVKPSELFKIAWLYYLTPKNLLTVRRFNKKAVVYLLNILEYTYKKAIVHPGEMVGMVAAQSIGEPTTQLTLNSVTYDTDIIVRNKDKKIIKIKIGKFIEEHIKKSKKIDYNREKDTTYAEMSTYYEVPDCDEDGNISWNEIEAVTQHPVVNEDGTNTLLKVKTNHGREVIATKAKSFLQLRDNKIVGYEGKKLKIGDYLPVSRKPIDFKEHFTLDLKALFPPTKYLFTSEVNKAKEVMTEYRWWSKHNGKTFKLPYKRSDTFVEKVSKRLRTGCKTTWEFKDNCVYPFPNTGKACATIPENIELSYNFGYLLGAYCAEGCITKTQISISNNNEKYYEPIQEFCKKYNITTKIYRHENKGKDGWVSQDIRIYSKMLVDIIELLCGKLSHGKKLHSDVIFSNETCLKGLLDAYIGGDGTISKKSRSIIIDSVSKDLLWDIHQILNILDIYSYMKHHKKTTKDQIFPTYVTPCANIKQMYSLYICNFQAKKLALILNMKIEDKQQNLNIILDYDYKYEYCRDDLKIPNVIDNKLVMEERKDRFPNVYFDRITKIENVTNNTNYVYDLTVKNTRNFNIYNGICQKDTFHFAGVASKSNVTRGVPRIEEILTLSENPKNPSITIRLKKDEEENLQKAQEIKYSLEYTNLRNVTETVSIMFDPNVDSTTINEDVEILEEFIEFEKMMSECGYKSEFNENDNFSKWIIRFELSKEDMLEKNISMDEINFAIKNSLKNKIQCIYSDFNKDNLVFRIRGVNLSSNKKKTLDQSDELYILKNLQDNILNNIVLRGVKNIPKIIIRKVKNEMILENGNYIPKDIWVLDTVGTNLIDILSQDNIDVDNTITNDIQEVYRTLGIEAARQAILNELHEAISHDGTYIDDHHLTMLADRITATKKMVSVFRHGINNDNIGPIAKACFEETPEMFLRAARHAELDVMTGTSANIMVGQEGYYGTGSFQILLNLKKLLSETTKIKEKELEESEDIDDQLVSIDDPCGKEKIKINTNIENDEIKDTGNVPDDYEMDL